MKHKSIQSTKEPNERHKNELHWKAYIEQEAKKQYFFINSIEPKNTNK